MAQKCQKGDDAGMVNTTLILLICSLSTLIAFGIGAFVGSKMRVITISKGDTVNDSKIVYDDEPALCVTPEEELELEKAYKSVKKV
jgi:hypothetical protein